jgi:hypothetical protein
MHANPSKYSSKEQLLGLLELEELECDEEELEDDECDEEELFTTTSIADVVTETVSPVTSCTVFTIDSLRRSMVG